MSEPHGSEPIDRVLHVGDLHFWHVCWNPLRLLNKRILGNLNVLLRRRREFAIENAKPFSRALGKTGVKQIILTGDFTSTALEEEYRMAREFTDGLRNRGFRLMIIPGNHDVYTFESVRRERWRQHFAEYLAEPAAAVRYVLPGGTQVTMGNTVCPNLVSSRGRITYEHINNMARLLREAEGPTIVACHYPLLDETYGYRTAPGRRLRNARAFRAALGSTGRRILYIHGHTHRFSYVRDPEFPSIEHLSTGAFFRRDRRLALEGEFSEIHVRASGFEVFRHTYTGEWRRVPVPVQAD